VPVRSVHDIDSAVDVSAARRGAGEDIALATARHRHDVGAAEDFFQTAAADRGATGGGAGGDQFLTSTGDDGAARRSVDGLLAADDTAAHGAADQYIEGATTVDAAADTAALDHRHAPAAHHRPAGGASGQHELLAADIHSC
jgi:hypothetical protein